MLTIFCKIITLWHNGTMLLTSAVVISHWCITLVIFSKDGITIAVVMPVHQSNHTPKKWTAPWVACKCYSSFTPNTVLSRPVSQCQHCDSVSHMPQYRYEQQLQMLSTAATEGWITCLMCLWPHAWLEHQTQLINACLDYQLHVSASK
jgi:hypothetical protein